MYNKRKSRAVKYSFILLLLTLIVTVYVSEAAAVNSVDDSIRTFTLNNRSSVMDCFMSFFSYIGNPEIITPIMLMMPDRKDLIKAVGATIAVTTFYKYLIGRTRPNEYDNGYLLFNPFYDFNSSMPSGHATAAFAFATVIDEYYPEQGDLAYTLASMVALSRIYLDRHWTTDVLTGAVIGHFGAKVTLAEW